MRASRGWERSPPPRKPKIQRDPFVRASFSLDKTLSSAACPPARSPKLGKQRRRPRRRKARHRPKGKGRASDFRPLWEALIHSLIHTCPSATRFSSPSGGGHPRQKNANGGTTATLDAHRCHCASAGTRKRQSETART